MNDFFTNVGIDPAIVILILAVFLVILFLVVFRMSSRLRKLEKKYRGFMKGKDGTVWKNTMRSTMWAGR